MLVAATSDVHSPLHFEEFVLALQNVKEKIDLFLLAGDMINLNKIEEYRKIENVLEKFDCPKIACFGNNEYLKSWEEIKKKIRSIKFLAEESVVFEVEGKRVGIVGSQGSLSKPTHWQLKNIPNIREIYEERIKIVGEELKKMEAEIKIVLLHYAPTFKTLVGEPPFAWERLGNPAFEKVLLESKPDLVIHGHSHKGSKKAFLNSIPIYNVAFPLHKNIVLIREKEFRSNLKNFLKDES